MLGIMALRMPVERVNTRMLRPAFVVSCTIIFMTVLLNAPCTKTFL